MIEKQNRWKIRVSLILHVCRVGRRFVKCVSLRHCHIPLTLRPTESVVRRTFSFIVGEYCCHKRMPMKWLIPYLLSIVACVCVCVHMWGASVSAVLCVKDTCLIHYLIKTTDVRLWQTKIRTPLNNITSTFANSSFCVCVDGWVDQRVEGWCVTVI